MTPEQRLLALRNLCGYVEDDSYCTVKIYQDDATRDWIVVVGKSTNWFHASSFNGAIDAAVAGTMQSRRLVKDGDDTRGESEEGNQGVS